MAKKENKEEKAAEQTSNGSARPPDYKSEGVAVWLNKKNNRVYLSIKIIGHNTIYANQNTA